MTLSEQICELYCFFDDCCYEEFMFEEYNVPYSKQLIEVVNDYQNGDIVTLNKTEQDLVYSAITALKLSKYILEN